MHLKIVSQICKIVFFIKFTLEILEIDANKQCSVALASFGKNSAVSTENINDTQALL